MNGNVGWRLGMASELMSIAIEIAKRTTRINPTTMNHRSDIEKIQTDGEGLHHHAKLGIMCPLPSMSTGKDPLSSVVFSRMQDIGCPLAADSKQRFQFEKLLSELSAKFINVSAEQVDSQIKWGLQQIVELLGIDRSGLGQVSADRKQIVVTHSYELPGIPPSAGFLLDSRFPYFAKMVYQGAVIRLPDELPLEASREREYCAQTGLRSNVTIPLVVMGSVVGGIGFTSFRSDRKLPDDLIPRLRMIGDIFTNALARKRADEELRVNEQSLKQAREDLRQLTSKLIHSQEEERARIAREMHDDWTQRLALLGIDAAKLLSQLESNDVALPLVVAMQDKVKVLAEDVHALSRQLHPSIINDLGLTEALRSECASFADREGIDIDYSPANVPMKLPKDVALCIYRVAQESLRNVAKHSAVNSASVMLVADERELRLRIEDCGIGFDPKDIRSQPGLGLSSMKERVSLIQGILTIDSARGKGTTVEVRVPLEGGNR